MLCHKTTASAEKFQHNSAYSLQLPLLDSNETGGLIEIGMNIIWSHFIVRYTTEDSFIIGVACDKKWGGGSEARKPRSLKSGGLKPSSLIEVYAYGHILPLHASAEACLTGGPMRNPGKGLL